MSSEYLKIIGLLSPSITVFPVIFLICAGSLIGKSLSVIEAVAFLSPIDSVRNSFSSISLSSTMSMLAVKDETPLGTLSTPLLRTNFLSFLGLLDSNQMPCSSKMTSFSSALAWLLGVDCEKVRLCLFLSFSSKVSSYDR